MSESPTTTLGKNLPQAYELRRFFEEKNFHLMNVWAAEDAKMMGEILELIEKAKDGEGYQRCIEISPVNFSTNCMNSLISKGYEIHLGFKDMIRISWEEPRYPNRNHLAKL